MRRSQDNHEKNMETNIDQSFNSKRGYFDSGATRSYHFRIEQLRKLKAGIRRYESEILDALHSDMHKPRFEAFLSEIGIMYEEIDHTIKHLKGWMKPEKLTTPLALQLSSSRIYTEPLGVVLIIGPWNYPFQLLMAPLVGAIAAGNCAIIKPSDNTRNTGSVVERLITEMFDPAYISVVQGPGAMIGPMLIEKFRFDHIFFTGSAPVGKKIMSMAAEHLSPVTLELGGKSPVIVDKDVNIDVAAKRLMWAKCFNAGQTCVCPDYLLVHESIKDQFVAKMKFYIKEFLGEKPLTSPNLTHIVNKRRFDTLTSYLNNVNILHGGEYDNTTLCMEPTIVDGVAADHPMATEEIFGPILPVYTFKDIEEVVPFIRKNRYPLACYIFTSNNNTEKFIIENIEFGGGCVNNALIHLANPELPFGGVGFSGMGNYHGKYSFEVFSHKKSMLKTNTFIDPSLRYAPYTESKMKWAHRLFG
ncbi:aldehyde dehydrogenase (NAD+) [Williamwhitmania taraxaci]|uniref:Aldehyde dehydrogenase n=2 Tax=Williamwhitmania taraxaci TaxID=1640674 RepID=A0A1G6H8E9_9BACT|nr:aldehyde dehydrogenase (NAD+) [Williamwhitmania taraxaci]